ncbi:MAG: DUF4446 family protein [Firmicutes bacterium]|nr:DUF4446 family protein [Bacillota bacterium]
MVHLSTKDLVYGTAILGVLALILGIWSMAVAYRLRSRYLKTFGADNPADVEALIANLHEKLDAAVDQFDALGGRVDRLDARVTDAISRVGLVRFNPFEDTGSDLSFSAALLNDHGDGLILTSLWGRDEVRLYAKPIEKHESRYVLSQEEKQALDLARHARRSGRLVNTEAKG